MFNKFFSSPKLPDRHVCATRVPSWRWHGNVLCVFIPRLCQFLRLYGITECEGFVEFYITLVGVHLVVLISIGYKYWVIPSNTTILWWYLFRRQLFRPYMAIIRSNTSLKAISSWNVADKGNQKYAYSEINLSRCHFVNYRFFMFRTAIEPRLLQWGWGDLDEFCVTFTLFIPCIMTKWVIK
jgi:hypothetical protein